MDSFLLAAPLFFLAAVLYTSVGHGGASGYLAVMALLGFAPALLRSTSLSLNILAAFIALMLFMRRSAARLDWQTIGSLCLPFALLGVPFAWLGGSITPTGQSYKALLGCVVLWAAWMLIRPKESPLLTDAPKRRAWMWPAAGIIGFLSGLTGIGGGIFLSPLLVFSGVASVKQSAPITAAVIFLNSLAALMGLFWSNTVVIAPQLPIWLMAVAIGAVLGAYWGSQRFNSLIMRRLLAMVLFVASLKLFAGLLT